MTRWWLPGMLSCCACALACRAPEPEPGPARSARVYEDLGLAAEGETVRAVVALPIRERAALDVLARDLYDPASPAFHRFLFASEIADRFLPTPADVEKVTRWAAGHGLRVEIVAANRLMIVLGGTARAFDDALTTTLHAYRHRTRGDRVFGTPGGVRLPPESGVESILTLDEPVGAAVGPDDPEPAEVPTATSAIGYLPIQIAKAYGVEALASATGGGRGARIGIVLGGGFRAGDVRAFQRGTGIDRAPAIVHEIGGPPSSRSRECTMLVEWTGALAPASEVIAYQGADARVSSTLFAFNEAIGKSEAHVIAFSHSRHESSESLDVRAMFDLSAELAAVAGVTVVAASGDTATPDIPATSPFVTAVGGTMLFLDEDGAREEAWGRSGSGLSSFATPLWQRGLRADTHGRRAIPDVALNAGIPYAIFYRGRFAPGGGTSIGAPVLASMLALVDAYRLARGLPPVGHVNPALYGDERVRRGLRDVITGGTRAHAAGPGWDFPTGWGAPDLSTLAEVLP